MLILHCRAQNEIAADSKIDKDKNEHLIDICIKVRCHEVEDNVHHEDYLQESKMIETIRRRMQ
jgi:hypothetical protein